MSYRIEAAQKLIAFKQRGFNEEWIKELRAKALKFLTPAIIAKVAPPYFRKKEVASLPPKITERAAKFQALSDRERDALIHIERKAFYPTSSEIRPLLASPHAAYKAIGKNLEWNLTVEGDSGATGDYAFFFPATASDSVLTPSQKSAAVLMFATLEALEEKSLSDNLLNKIIQALAGLDADAEELGKKFKIGRKPQTGSAIRKTIAKLLKNDPTMENPELWAAVAKKPPKEWTAYDNHVGKYLEGKKASDSMGYARFCNVCGEERKKLKQ